MMRTLLCIFMLLCSCRNSQYAPIFLDKNTYEIIETEINSTIENHYVLIKNLTIQKDTIQEFINKFTIIHCKDKCNIFLVDDKSIYPLMDRDPDGKDYIKVANHFVAQYLFDFDNIQMYPFQDSLYRQLGGTNWKQK